MRARAETGRGHGVRGREKETKGERDRVNQGESASPEGRREVGPIIPEGSRELLKEAAPLVEGQPLMRVCVTQGKQLEP